MTTFLKSQQAKAREDFYAMAKDIREYGEFPVQLEEHLLGYFLKGTAQTIKDTTARVREVMGEERSSDGLTRRHLINHGKNLLREEVTQELNSLEETT